MNLRVLRVALLAFPRRWRDVHADEFVTTAMELDTEGTRRSAASALIDVVVGGLRLRFRTRPPLWRWALYRLQIVRMSPRWHEWVRDDVRGRWFALRGSWFVYWLTFVIMTAIDVGMSAYFDPGFDVRARVAVLTRIQVIVFAGMNVVFVPLALALNRRAQRTTRSWLGWEGDDSGPWRAPWGPPSVAPEDHSTT